MAVRPPRTFSATNKWSSKTAVGVLAAAAALVVAVGVAAHASTTAEADEILVDKGVFVIPDILANSGGVTVSYFEWVQDRQGYFWTESMVNDHLQHTMRTAFTEVLKYAETHKVSNRIAAYMLALDRVAYTLRQRGIYA